MKLKKNFSHLKGGEVILIENIRFFKEETEDDQSFSKKLGSLGDIYINDAFFHALLGSKLQFII